MPAIIATLLFVGVVISDIALLISAANTKGVGFREYIQLSDFGIFVLQFGVHPVWAAINVVAVLIVVALWWADVSRR